MFRVLLTSVLMTWFSVSHAAAAASCAGKFVGSWQVKVDATGQTYPAVISANGRTHVTCPMCTPGGSWTCSGDTITVTVDSGPTVEHRMQPGGRIMTGGCCTLTRLGAPPEDAVASSATTPKSGATVHLPGALSLLKPQKAQAATVAKQESPPASVSSPVSPSPPTGQSFSCGSDITGVGGASPSASQCLQRAKWTGNEPYNHGPAIAFHPFRGRNVEIPTGSSLWSVPDNGSTGRHLEAMPWDKVTAFFAKNGCAQEGTSAQLKAFIVNVECEMNRQEDLQKEFEAREDRYPYIDYRDCKAPRKIEMMSGWQSKQSEFWSENPSEPVGWCVSPLEHGRQDKQPIREPKWHTAQECADELSANVVKISSRGVKGCTFKNE